MDNNVDTAAVQIENNTKYSMSTVVNLALADQYLLDKDVTFNITEKSSEVYVRCALKFTCTSWAEVAKDMIKFQDYKLGTNAGYSWQQFGEYFYLCDETGIPKTIERSQAGQIFTFVEKENLLLPHDAIVGKHFTTADQVTMTVEIEAIQGRNLEDSSIFELNQYFLTEIPSNTYTVKFHEADGTILSEQANIAYGSNAIVPEIEKEKAADHTTFAYWSTTEDGDGLKIREADETRIFSNISQNMEVWPVYAHDQVKIDVTYGNGGQITPGSTTIDWGTGKTFRVVADSGHAIQQIKRDGVVIYDFSGSKIDMFDYVLENVVADTQIEATFEPVTYEIIVITVGNGTVEPGTTTAVYGSSKAFTMTPDEGYRIWSITLDGVEIPVTASSGNAQRYTISNINSDHILSVKFVTSILKITTVAGANGTIRPNELEVEYDSFASVSIVPNEGYEISSIYIDGVKVDDSKVAKGGVAQNISFEHVTEDHEVRATFSRIKLTITASAGEGGLISPKGEIGCEYGATVSFDIIPDALKTIDKIYVDGAEVAVTVTEGDKQTYVFENVKDSHTIFATFKRSYIRLDINGGSGSQPSISYSLDGTKFTLSNVEPKGPGGKEFYYYSTRAFDNERGQLGDRYDLGYEYDIPDLENTTTLYAIYLEPTTDVTVYSQFMVIPKGTQTLKRLGFEEAMNEVMKGNEDNPLSQLIAVMLGIVFATTQKDTNLVYCTLPAGLTTLEWYAFSGCVSLTGVSVPASLSSISLSAFSNTTSLEKFTIPYSCVSLGSNVFENSGVQYIKMNKKLQSIGAAAFKSSGLKEFKVQSSITSMGKVDTIGGSTTEEYQDTVFHDCASLEKLDFSEQSSFLGQTIQNCTALKEVILPQPLTTIPDNQFRNCQSLSYVSYKNGDTLVNKFPSTLKKIGAYAFYSCSFTDLLLDDCTKVLIGDHAFVSNAFETLNVQNGKISEVGAYAFSSCSNLKTVNWEIEYNVPEYCFAYSSNLQAFKTTSIKDGIMGYAFVDCLKLDSVDIKNNGAEFIISAGAFKNCVIADMVFPEGITTIGSQAFYGNLFKEIVFPSTLLNLANDSLQNCSRLEKFELKTDLTSTITNLNKIGNGPTWYIEGEPYLVGTERSSAPDGIGPKGVYTIYPGKANRVDWEWIEVVSDTQIKRYTTSTDSNGNKTTISTLETKNYPGTEIGKKYITKYIPESVEAGTLNIIIPTAVIDLGGTIHDIEGIVSFETNDVITQKLTSGDTVNLELMSGLTYVGANCFNNTNGKKLASISISMSIKYIGESAFQGTKVSSLYLPNLTFVGASAFASCSNLTSVELSNLITEIPDSCFQNSGLTSMVMPQYLEKIGASAFASTKITKLYLPSTLSEIGASAFVDCDKLTSIEGLSNTKITEIQTQTFNRCSSLTKVYFPSTLKTIGFWAFNACSSLTYVTFGSAIEQIDTYAFSYCNKIANLDFPASLTSIGESAFVGCSSLANLTFRHTSFANFTIGASAFGETTSALVVYIQNVIALNDFKAKFDGTTTDKGFAEDATLYYQSAKNPLAFYKSKEWKAVRNVVVYCGEGGSATIKFGTNSEVLIQSAQQRTFNIINGTSYELLIYPDTTTDFFALVVNSDSYKEGLETFGTGNRNRKYSSTINENTNIQITFNKPVVYLDENGANGTNWKKHDIEEGANKETFTIVDGSENNYTKDGKPFYFYSTIASDNETKQNGTRFDVGVTYPVSSLHGVKTLYAIYLTPTAESNFTMESGTISLKSGVSKISNLVIPKTVGGVKVTGIAARGFSNAAASGYIDGDTITSRVSGLVTMPSTITTIGERAFAGNSEISSMFSFPYALKNLGNEAFALCNFTAVNINLMVAGSNVVKFENNILYTTDGAYQFALGTKATSISDIDATAILPHAFANSDIKAFNDFGKITSYGAYAFADCDSTELVMIFTKKASQVTFGEGVFEGTVSKLRIYVPSGDVENYITKFTNQLGFQNGTLIYNGSDSTIPYAQYYNDDKNDNWKRIYKVTTSTLPTGGKSITIYNLSAQEDKSMTFEAYSKAFSGNIEGYYREDWKLSVVVISDSEGGYTLKTFEIGKKQSNGVFNYSKISLSEGRYDTSGSQFTYEIASYSRKEDWDIRVDFEVRTQNVVVYMDAGVNTSTVVMSSAFTGPTSITTGDFSGYKSYSSTFKFNSTFTITKAEPNKSYIITSIKFREKIYNEAAGQYSWSDWRNISYSNFEKIGSNGYNSLNGYTSSKIANDIEFVIQTQYAPFILSISGTNEPLGLQYNSSSKQFEELPGANLIQSGFTTVTIPTVYDSRKQGGAVLYYFLHQDNRYDTGIAYPASMFTQNTYGYYMLEAKLFTPISADYYDTSLSGAFKLTKKFTLSNDAAIPKTIGGKATTTILSNLDSSLSQYYQISGLTLPKTVTNLEMGAFAMSKISGKIYLPTNLTGIAEGALTTTLNASFNQTRLSSITYAFAISNDKNYITISNGKTLVCANSNITVSTIPSGITKLGAYVFAGRSSGEYSDANNSVVSYGVGVFFNTSINRYTFTKKSNNVSFDGLLLNLNAQASVYVADDGYMETLNNRGFWSYVQTTKESQNNYTSMYLSSNLLAIYRNDVWQEVFYYTYEFKNMNAIFTSVANYEFVSSNKTYLADGILTYEISGLPGDVIISKITYSDIATGDVLFEDSNPVGMRFEYTLSTATKVTITLEYQIYRVEVEFDCDSVSNDIFNEVYQQANNSLSKIVTNVELAPGTEAAITLKETVGEKKFVGTFHFNQANEVTFKISLKSDSIFSIGEITYAGQNASHAYGYNTKTYYEFSDIFEQNDQSLIVIKAKIIAAPINLDANGGIARFGRDKDINSLIESSALTKQTSGSKYSFYFMIEDPQLNLTLNDAECYFFSDDQKSVDLSGNRYDFGLIYKSELDINALTRTTLYARYAKADSGNWSISNGVLTYNSTTTSGVLYSGTTATSTNILVIPKYVSDGTEVTGFSGKTFANNLSGAKYVVLPGNCTQLGENAYTNLPDTKIIQLPANAQLTGGDLPRDYDFVFRKLHYCEYVNINNHYDSNQNCINILSSKAGALHSRGALVFHPEKLLMTSATLDCSLILPYACENCNNGSAEVTLNGVTICEYAFYNCVSIKSISGIDSVGEKAFYHDQDHSTSIESISGALFRIANSAFYDCFNLKNVSIGWTTEIQDRAFYNCYNLECDLIIDAETIGEYVFACDEYHTAKSFYVSFPTLKTIGSGVFLNSSVNKITFSDNFGQSFRNDKRGMTTYQDLDKKERYTITDISQAVDICYQDNTFRGTKNLQYVYYFSNIGDIVIEDINFDTIYTNSTEKNKYVAKLRDKQLFGDSPLVELSFNSKAMYIGNYAFAFKTTLISLEFVGATPGKFADVTTTGLFGLGIHHNFGSLTNGVAFVGNRTFESCSLSEVQGICSLVKIGDYAFANNKFKILDFDSENPQAMLNTIGVGAFRYNSMLNELKFANSLGFVMEQAFANCNLQKIFIENAGIKDFVLSGSAFDEETSTRIKYLSSTDYRFESQHYYTIDIQIGESKIPVKRSYFAPLSLQLTNEQQNDSSFQLIFSCKDTDNSSTAATEIWRNGALTASMPYAFATFYDLDKNSVQRSYFEDIITYNGKIDFQQIIVRGEYFDDNTNLICSVTSNLYYEGPYNRFYSHDDKYDEPGEWQPVGEWKMQY